MPARVYGGFGPLPSGMDAGRSPSLLPPTKFALGVNTSVNDSLINCRPNWNQHALTFPDTTTQSNFSGKFQGSEPYTSDEGSDGWVVSIGGHLFFVNTSYMVTEVTPKIAIVTTANFLIPGAGNPVNILVSDSSPLSVGQIVIIDSGSYVITNLFTNGITATYSGGAANATASAGNGVLDENSQQIYLFQTNPADYDFIYMFQAEFYMVVLGGQHKTIIFDGSHARQTNSDEIPPGIIGAYGWGRIWICLDDRRSFVAGNLCFDTQGGGTQQFNFRDSIIKFTDNDFLNTSGTFGVPMNVGPITSMQFLATQDTSLGVGVLLIGTSKAVFSVNAPVDRTTWKNLRYPIQTVSLIGSGPKGPRSTIPVNQDMWFRSKEGLRSFIVARRQMEEPGNVPQSNEVSNVLDDDDFSLLFWGSAVYFDNRLLMTCAPERTSTGVHHFGLVALNYDEFSSLQDKAPQTWEGFWSGLNIYQIMQVEINEVDRCFAFVKGPSGIEFWELLAESQEDGGDQIENIVNGVRTLCKTPIQWAIESRRDPHGDPDQLINLVMGTLFVDQIRDNVTIVVKWRPDQYPIYNTWATINLCATVAQCLPPPPGQFSCSVWQPNATQYLTRLTLPQPPDTCALVPNVPIRLGREFQYRLEVTGRCRIRMFRAHAEPVAQEMEGECPAVVQCMALPFCDLPIFNFDSHGTCQSGGITTYQNTRQCQTAYCPVGTTGNPQTACVDAGKFSSTISQADADNQAKAAALTLAKGMLSCSGAGSCSDLIPQMTGPTTPSGTASASSQNSILPAWMAFDDTLGLLNRWKASAVPPQWVQYQFGAGQTVKAYRVHTVASAWQFQGSNDGSTWTTLDTQTGQLDTTITGGLYLIPNTTSYSYYRMYITAGPNGSTTTLVDVTELELFGCQTPQ